MEVAGAEEAALRLDGLAKDIMGEDVVLEAERRLVRRTGAGQVFGVGGEVEAASGLQLVQQQVHQQKQLTPPESPRDEIYAQCHEIFVHASALNMALVFSFYHFVFVKIYIFT